LNFTLRPYRLLAENGRVKSHVATTKYTKGDCKSADGQRMSGADLSRLTRGEEHRLLCHSSTRTGENSPSEWKKPYPRLDPTRPERLWACLLCCDA